MRLTRPVLVLCAALVLLLALVALWQALRPTTRTTPGACTHWASPTGTGTTCTADAPCLPASWWPLARPGTTLCLRDGTYRGSPAMINPPDTLAGTQSAPITIRALHDGQVLLDAEHRESALTLVPGNDWFVVQGMNATNGKESVWSFGGSHNRGRRLIAWNGTSGQANSYAFALGRQVDNVVEDCAAWGSNMRKLFEGGQSLAEGQLSQWAGFRRCWGEWTDWPGGESYPTNTFQMGYRTRQQRYENVLGTWNTAEGGQTGSPDGIVSFFYDCNQPLDVFGSALLGSVLYLLPGQRFPGSALANVFCTKNAAWKEVVAYVGEGHEAVKPLFFNSQTSTEPQTGNVCTNCVGVHHGTPSVNSPQAGWSLPGFREGRSVEEVTGGQSLFTMLPGLCTRYVGGELTSEPLWPFPLNERIKTARAQGGYPVVDVTATMEQLFGPIPPQCRADAPKPPEPPTPGGLTLACSGTVSAVPGTVQLTCTRQQEGRR